MFTDAASWPTEAHMPKTEPLFYISTKGEMLDPGELHLARFSNGIRLIEREREANPNWENLPRLKEIFERRQKEWDAAHPDEARPR